MGKEHDALLRLSLISALGDPQVVSEAFQEPHRDLFELGLDSLRAFEVLDVLSSAGIEVDFLDFTTTPTVHFLRSAIAQ